MAEPHEYCYVNGEIESIEDARIPVLDRGFIFGDAVYEVIPVFDGIAFRLSDHLNRLELSLDAIGISPPFAWTKWAEIIEQLVQLNGGGDQSVYMQVTRGVAPRDHVMKSKTSPTVVLICSPLEPGVVKPAIAVTRADNRWERCNIKSTSLLANVLLRAQAHALDADEAILIRDGRLTEGAASNVFVVKQSQILTPPISNEILAGVTRNLLVEILRDTAEAVTETEVGDHTLRSADEIWLTSSSRELFPVITLDGEPVGTGKVGPIFKNVDKIYQSYKAAWIAARQPV